MCRRASRRSVLAALLVSGCVEPTVIETAPLRTIEVLLPENTTDAFLSEIQSFARTRNFRHHIRSNLVPNAGEAIAFELHRSDLWILGRNLAEQVDDEPRSGVIGPTVAYDQKRFRVSIFPKQTTPTQVVVSGLVGDLVAVAQTVGGACTVH